MVVFMASIGVNIVKKAFESTQNEESVIEVDWNGLYPFQETAAESPSADLEKEAQEESGISKLVKRYTATVKALEEKVSSYTEKMFLFQKELVTFGTQLENMIGWELESNQSESNQILYMDNGYLTNVKAKASEETIEELADSIADLYAYLEESDIPFLYMNAGSKVCRYDRQLSDDVNEHSNENADALLEALSKRQVPAVDYRNSMEQAQMSHYDYYYKTDLHWTTEAGLWAAGVLADSLNNDYGFQFDLSYFDLNNYEVTEYDSYWLGSQGRTVTLARAELETWNLMLPKFATDYTVNVPSRQLEITGAYDEALFDREAFDAIASYSGSDYLNMQDAYACSRLRNDALAVIQNNLETNNEGKKILMIQDSFGNYMSAYLAADVEQIDVLYPKQFTGSIRTYIEQTQPDMVVVMFSQDNIGPVDWNTHSSIFDFR